MAMRVPGNKRAFAPAGATPGIAVAAAPTAPLTVSKCQPAWTFVDVGLGQKEFRDVNNCAERDRAAGLNTCVPNWIEEKGIDGNVLGRYDANKCAQKVAAAAAAAAPVRSPSNLVSPLSMPMLSPSITGAMFNLSVQQAVNGANTGSPQVGVGGSGITQTAADAEAARIQALKQAQLDELARVQAIKQAEMLQDKYDQQVAQMATWTEAQRQQFYTNSAQSNAGTTESQPDTGRLGVYNLPVPCNPGERRLVPGSGFVTCVAPGTGQLAWLPDSASSPPPGSSEYNSDTTSGNTGAVPSGTPNSQVPPTAPPAAAPMSDGAKAAIGVTVLAAAWWLLR